MVEIDVIGSLPTDAALLMIMKVVQVIAGIGMVITIIVAVWSSWLQKKEVLKQNQRIIELLEEIRSGLRSG